MPYFTSNYKINAMLGGDPWYPDVDQRNMQIVENLMQSAEYFTQNGILNLNACGILSSATGSLKQSLYNAAFDYYNDIFFNAENYDLHYISNEDVVVDLVAKTNINIANIFSQNINGAPILPGYNIFLTSQSLSTQNGVYQVSLSGASLLPNQPKKVFVNANDPIYQYSIFLFNITNYSSVNTYDCLIVVDGLIAIQNSRAITSPKTCYLRPSTGSNILTAYSPTNYYGSGTPILFLTNILNDTAVQLANYTTSGSSFSNYAYIQNFSVVGSGSYLTNFNSQTYNQQASYKPLHIHANQSSKQPFTNFIKLILKPQGNFSNSCAVYDTYGNVYTFSYGNQKIESIYLNEQNISTKYVQYNNSTRTFNFAFPVAYTDDIYCIVSQNIIQTLSPLSSINNGAASFTLYGSGNSTPYTWTNTTYDNYNFYINGSTISQQSFSVSPSAGTVSIVQPNVSNLPYDPNIFSGSILELSSSTNDQSSFFGKTDKIQSLNPGKITGIISNYRAKHNQFDTQVSNVGYSLVPFRYIGNNTHQIPYYNGNYFNSIQPIDSIQDAFFTANFAVINISGFVFILLNQQLFPILEKYSDQGYIANIIKPIKNTQDSFIVLFTNTISNQYAISIVNLDADTFNTYQFIFGSTINDINSYFDGVNTNIFLATSSGTYTANFSNLNPVFNKLYYTFSYSGSNLYSFNSHQVNKITISDSIITGSNVAYEGYILINNYPYSGSQIIGTINSQNIIYTGSNLSVFDIGTTNGISNSGVVIGDNNNMYVSTSPVFYSGSVLFPFTYGANIQVGNNAVSCYTSTISSVNSFSGASIYNLDASSVSAGQYILVRQQPNSTQNGVYLVNSVSGSIFYATQQNISNAAIGNYVLVNSGSRHANSYWEISPTSYLPTNNLVFRLRSTNIASGFGSVKKLFTDLNNAIYLSSTGSITSIYDSTNINFDVYKHQFSTTSTVSQIFGSSSADNLIVSAKSILSENFTGPRQGYYSFIDYTYPLIQGGTIYIKNSSANWILNQLIQINYNKNNVIACINTISGSNYTANVVSTNTVSLGQSYIGTNNLTFNNLVQNNNFQQNWFSQIYGVSSGSYLVPLSSAQYSGSILTNSITITDSNYFNSPVYGKLIINKNLQIDSSNNYIQNDNSLVVSYNNSVVSEFNQTTDSNYILDHNTGYKTLMQKTAILIDPNNSSVSDNVVNYDGVISTLTGSLFAQISSSSVSSLPIPANSVVYETQTNQSNSIENRIFGNNQFSSQTISNSVLLNNNLLNAINNYSNAVSASYEDIVVDSAISSTYEALLSDFSTGLSNYTYDSWLGTSDESVHAVFNLNSKTYAVIQGKIVTVGSPSIVVAKFNFNFCYCATTNGSYLIICTDKGLYVFDYNFNLLFKTLLDHKIKTGLFISPTQIFVGVENNLCYVNLATYTTDYMALPVSSINAIAVIANSTENLYLIGTDAGLFCATLNASTSGQQLITGNGIVGVKFITLSSESRLISPAVNQNNILGVYGTLNAIMPSETLSDSTGQPNILDIVVLNNAVFLATENGIDLYENLYSIDMQNSSNNYQNFNITSNKLQGFAVNKFIKFYDSGSKISAYFVSTFDGLYYSFDGLNTFIKSSLNYPTFSALATGSSWFIASTTGLYSTNNYGNTYSGSLVARGAILNTNQNIDIIFNVNNDYILNSVNIPIFASSGSYNLNLSISSAHYITGEPVTGLATASFITGSLLNGFYVLPFILNTPVVLKNTLTYNLTINSTVATGNIYLSDQNYASLGFNILNCRSTGSPLGTLPAIKLCQNSINTSNYINQSLPSSRFINYSNIVIDTGNNIYSYPSAEINFIIDNSNSFLNLFGGISNINSFISTIQSQFITKIGNYCYFNTIFTDDYLTGFSNLSTGSAPLATTGSALSRIVDAICMTSVRNGSNFYAPSTISTGSFASYVSGSNALGASSFVFKNILNTNQYYPNLNLQYNYNTSLINGTSYNITQNGFTGSIAGSTYVFVDNIYANPSDYTLNTQFVYTGASIVNKNLSNVTIYTSTGSPTLSNISNLPSFGSYFSKPWSQWIASTQSKIVVVLSDNIDNDSVENLSDYVSLFSNTNTLVILCSSSIESGTLYNYLSENVISVPKLSSESVSSYILRVNTFINNMTHRVFGGSFDLIIENTVTNITINFNNLNVFGIMRDLETNNIIKNITFSSGIPVSTIDTNQQKRITIFFSGTGSITGVYETYVYPSQFLYSRTLASGSSYNNEIIFGNVTKALGNSSSNFYPVSGSNTIHQISSGWSTSPHGTPFWTKDGAGMLAISGSNVSFSGSATEIPSNIAGYRKFYVGGPSIYTRLPINASSSLSTGSSWYDWYNNVIFATVTGSGFYINTNLNSLLTFRYPYNDTSSSQNSLVPWDSLINYARTGRSLIFDSTKQFKIFGNIENYNNYSYSSKINVYFSGNIPNNSVENKFIRYPYNIVNTIYKPTLPILPYNILTLFTKYQDYNVSIFGYSTSGLSNPGRKPVYISSSTWVVSGSSINSNAIYTGSSAIINSLNYTLTNMAGETTGSSFTGFNTDVNFTPIIVNTSTLINGIPSNSAGLNDTISLSVVVDRKDGTSNSQYIYQYNVGDQIILIVNWYGVGGPATPTLISSGNVLQISNTYVSSYNYVYAKIQIVRGLTMGSLIETMPVFLS